MNISVIFNKALFVEEICRGESTLHFTWMFLIQTILYHFFGKYAIIFTFIFAFGKEIFDVKIKHGRFSIADISMTILGGLLALIIQQIPYAKIKFIR